MQTTKKAYKKFMVDALLCSSAIKCTQRLYLLPIAEESRTISQYTEKVFGPEVGKVHCVVMCGLNCMPAHLVLGSSTRRSYDLEPAWTGRWDDHPHRPSMDTCRPWKHLQICRGVSMYATSTRTSVHGRKLRTLHLPSASANEYFA